MAAEVLDVASLDSAASAVDNSATVTETPAAEPISVPEIDASAEPAKHDAATTTDGDKSAVEKTTETPSTPTQIAAALQKFKDADAANAPIAKALYTHVKSNLEAQKFLKEIEAKDFADARKVLNERVAAGPQQFIDNVTATDELLYAGAPELADNIWDVLQSQSKPQMLARLGENILAKLAEVDSPAHASIMRGMFLDAAEQTGLTASLNSIARALQAGDTATARATLSSIVEFMSQEIEADNKTKIKRETERQNATKATERETAAQREIQKAANKEADQLSNRILGAALGELMRGPLKSLDRRALEDLANGIKTCLHEDLKADKAYQSTMDKLWKRTKSSEDKAALLSKHEAKLKSITKTLVSRVAAKCYPNLMTQAKPTRKPATPASTKVTIGGKSQTVFQLEKRPANLVRSDVEVAGRTYTSKDLELLQAAKGIGLVPNKSGKGHSFVQWKR